MHLGRRLGNPLGKFVPENLPGMTPTVPFLDMRLVDNVSISVRTWVDVPRFEYLTHLFKNGQYRQTKNIQFTPVSIYVSFEVEDTGGGATFTASIYRRDNPLAVKFNTVLTLTGAGVTEASSLNSVQQIVNLGGGWFSILMKLQSTINDQFKLSFNISGGDTRVGSVEVIGIESGHARFDLSPDMTTWNEALVANGLTGSSDTAYDLSDDQTSFHDVLKFIVDFDEQILGSQRSTFSAAFSGPRNSQEGREMEARGLLGYCPSSNRLNFKWTDFVEQLDNASVLIEYSKNGATYVLLATVMPGITTYTTPQLDQGVYRFRLRTSDVAGNVSDHQTFADFAPRTWFDPNDPSTVFTDLAGTVPIENDQDRVARIDSKGSFGMQIQQTTAGNRPYFVYEGINHGAGLHLQGGQFHLDGSSPASWIGGGQQFDLYMSVLLNSSPTTLPLNSDATTAFTKLFSFEGFFELIAAKYSNYYFETPDSDYNTGYAIIARIYTGAGMRPLVMPIILEEILIIRAAYDGNALMLNVNDSQMIIPAPGPNAPTDVRVWGTNVANKGINGFVGPLLTFQSPQTNPVAEQILSMLRTESYNPTAFIIKEQIIAPSVIDISFSGSNGIVSSHVSPSPSVTEYNIYHNNGTNEFPDFSTPADTQASPSFTVPLTAGTWRFVIRASDGIIEDGNFENRLDVTIVESSPGVMRLAGPQPNPVSQFNVLLKPNGFIQFSAVYSSLREQAIGNRVNVWVFEEHVVEDLTSLPAATMMINLHQVGTDQAFFLQSLVIGPYNEEPHYAVAKVMSSEGDYETRNPIKVRFTPDATKPISPLGLRGNPC